MATMDHATEVKPAKPDTIKEREAGAIGLRKNNMSPSASFASPADQIVYSHNVFVPHPQAYYYGGYEGGVPEWDEYPSYINAEGIDIRSPGIYNENPSMMYHPGYGYTPQMPYAPYPPATPPLASVSGEPPMFSPQHYPFTGPAFYPHPYVASPPPVSQPDSSPIPTLDQHNETTIYGPRPHYPTPVGSVGRGRGPGRHGSASHDMLHGFDGVWSGGLWSDWPKASSVSPFSPALSPQPLVGDFSSFGSNIGSAPLSQRLNYDSGSSGSHSFGRGYVAGIVNRGSTYENASISSLESNNRGWFSLESMKSRSRSSIPLCGCNGIDIFTEQNRGPRASKPRTEDAADRDSPERLSRNKPKYSIHNEHCNQPDFVTEYNDAKFFIIKSYSEDNVHKSIKYGVWASTPNGNKRLDAAYHDAKSKLDPCPIFLLFSVNASGQFCGVAEMVGEVDFDKNVEFWQQDKWSGQFPVTWHIIKDVPNSHFRHILLENNDNKPVTNSRDTQEVKLEQGVEMLKIFKSYDTEMSILDDFEFYEARQKVMQEQKAKQQASIMAAGMLADGEAKAAVSLPNEFIKHMSKSFAQAVLLDEAEKDDSAMDSPGKVDDVPHVISTA